MRAAVYHRFGGPDEVRIEDVPKPTPRATEVVIRVAATTVSAADHRSRSKDIPAGLRIPSSLVLGIRRPRRPILGMEVAGVIESVGAGVTRFRSGDEVVAMLGSRFGGHAEYAVADESDAIVLKPSSLSFPDAAALIFGGITARAFFNQARLVAGSRVLVNGASGAVGVAAVQLAKAAGAHVTAVTSAGNANLVRSLGADGVIDYRAQDFATGDERYDIVMDCVGNAPFARVHPVVDASGAVLHVAGDLRTVITASGNGKRHGLTVTAAPGAYRASDLEHLLELAAGGSLRAVIDRTYPLEQIAEAHRFVDAGRKRGSVVIEVAALEQQSSSINPIEKKEHTSHE